MRAKVAEAYRTALAHLPELVLPALPAPGVEQSWFVFVVRLQDEFDRADRDVVLEQLRNQGIGCNNYFAPIHLQSFYQERFGFRRGQFPITEHVADRTIALPFFNTLSADQIGSVASALRRAFQAVKQRVFPVYAVGAR
jgi:perosamine synthetase